MESIAEAIKSRLSQTHEKNDFEVVVPLMLMRQALRTKRIFNTVLGSIAGISLLVGGIGIMNIMLASVSERTREIGIRRALGATRKDILSQFMTETTLLASVGGLVGVSLGMSSPGSSIIYGHDYDRDGGRRWHSRYRPPPGFCLGLSCNKAACLSPVEAVRRNDLNDAARYFHQSWNMQLASAYWMQFMAPVQCKGVGLGQGFGSMLTCLWCLLLVPHGRVARPSTKSANREAASLIAEKSTLIPNMEPSFELQEIDPADLTSMPVSENLEAFLGKTGQSEVGACVVSLEAALELATAYNRRYLTQKEDLYLQALDLSLARFQYTPIFGSSGDVAYQKRQRLAGEAQSGIDGLVKEKTIQSNAGVVSTGCCELGGVLQLTSPLILYVSFQTMRAWQHLRLLVPP